MTQQIINIGSAPNDGTGDHLRVAFGKSNANFTELYAGSGGGVPEAPTDGQLYGRLNAAWSVVPSTDLSAYAPLASPHFTGNPSAPPPTPGVDTSIATSGYVIQGDIAVKSQLIGTASAGFDTMGEIENYIAANITPALGNKADIFSPTFAGDPKAPTPATSDNDTSIATTSYVKANLGNYVAKAGDTMTGALHITDTTASGSPATGALTVAGGVGVGGALYTGPLTTSAPANPIIYLDRAGTQTWFMSSTGGAADEFVLAAPGINIWLKAQRASGNISVISTTPSSSPLTGALTVAGGVGVNGALNVNDNIKIDGAALPQLTFAISGTVQSFINDNSGSINIYSNAGGTAGMYIAHGANAWTAISDARLPYKKTARPLSALDKLEHVHLYENEVDGVRLELFAKAQEMYQAFPHVVAKGDDDPTFTPTGAFDGKTWAMSYERLGVVALQAVKELLAKVNELEARIAVLEAG